MIVFPPFRPRFIKTGSGKQAPTPSGEAVVPRCRHVRPSRRSGRYRSPTPWFWGLLVFLGHSSNSAGVLSCTTYTHTHIHIAESLNTQSCTHTHTHTHTRIQAHTHTHPGPEQHTYDCSRNYYNCIPCQIGGNQCTLVSQSKIRRVRQTLMLIHVYYCADFFFFFGGLFF